MKKQAPVANFTINDPEIAVNMRIVGESGGAVLYSLNIHAKFGGGFSWNYRHYVLGVSWEQGERGYRDRVKAVWTDRLYTMLNGTTVTDGKFEPRVLDEMHKIFDEKKQVCEMWEKIQKSPYGFWEMTEFHS